MQDASGVRCTVVSSIEAALVVDSSGNDFDKETSLARHISAGEDGGAKAEGGLYHLPPPPSSLPSCPKGLTVVIVGTVSVGAATQGLSTEEYNAPLVERSSGCTRRHTGTCTWRCGVSSQQRDPSTQNK